MTFNEFAKVVEPDYQYIHVHFVNKNFTVLASRLKKTINSNAEIGTIYVGIDNEMHIILRGEYKTSNDAASPLKGDSFKNFKAMAKIYNRFSRRKDVLVSLFDDQTGASVTFDKFPDLEVFGLKDSKYCIISQNGKDSEPLTVKEVCKKIKRMLKNS